MFRHRRLLLAALGTALGVACGLRSPAPEAGARGPVGLLVEGSAFARPGVRDGVVRALERVSRRRVLLLGAPASMGEAGAKELAARLRKETPSLGRYDWKEPRCASHVDVLTAVQRHVDAVYRVSLDYTTHSRPATEPERALRGSGVLRALSLAEADTVREEALTGVVTLSVFAPETVHRAPVSRTAKVVEPSKFASPMAIDTAVSEVLASLPAVPEPQWEAVARQLVSHGCPFLALAVAETRLKPAGGDAVVRKAAVAAIGRSLGKRPAGRSTRETKAPPRREVEEAAAADTRGGDDKYSCSSLCSMHMVQLCNNDKVLWSSHRAKWEATPCGARRPEPFLQECYQQQWLSSTFRDACLQPCERSAGGRDRLVQILRDAGCVRLDAS